jgi:uncharacterized membrane protein YiaA
LENIKVTDIYYGICWFATLSSIVLLAMDYGMPPFCQAKKDSMDLPFYWLYWSHCCSEKYKGQYDTGIK